MQPGLHLKITVQNLAVSQKNEAGEERFLGGWEEVIIFLFCFASR